MNRLYHSNVCFCMVEEISRRGELLMVPLLTRWQGGKQRLLPVVLMFQDVQPWLTSNHDIPISFPKIIGDFIKEMVPFSHPASCTGQADPGRRTNHELLDGMGLVPGKFTDGIFHGILDI